MKERVSKNLKILGSKTKHSEGPTCSVCLKEDIPVDELATLDGCTHQFCADCIIGWTKKCKNICPNCNATIKEITYKDSKGKEQINKVELVISEDSSDEYGSEYDEPCVICNEIMTHRFREETDDWELCERCL